MTNKNKNVVSNIQHSNRIINGAYVMLIKEDSSVALSQLLASLPF
ncbi:MAG: hypothetical protein ACI90V_014423, partial [Bacillariaceae sp.]